MEEKIMLNPALAEYLMTNIKTMVECDVEEKEKKFPYTCAVNNLFNFLKLNHNIDFNEKLISEELLGKMVDEITFNITK